MTDSIDSFVIDVDRLRADYMADDEFLGDILELFIREIDKALTEVASIDQIEPFKAIRSIAHRLKGSMLAVALDGAAEQMKLIEALAESSDKSDIQSDRLKERLTGIATACREPAVQTITQLGKRE